MMLCNDCQVDTEELQEYYMVHGRLWDKAGMQDGFLCVGCLEVRLGRLLTAEDFTDCLLNDISALESSDRLVARFVAPPPA